LAAAEVDDFAVVVVDRYIWREAVEDGFAVTFGYDEALVAKHLQVVRQEALFDLEAVVDLADVLGTIHQLLHDGESGLVSEDLQE
jgi:hypothetical protein